ncbi:MAG: SEC-C metal-binding domain-containing protein [Polyangiaceae bacterium]
MSSLPVVNADFALTELRAIDSEELPPELKARILALGGGAVPELLSILQDEALASVDSPEEGWPPIHAVDLLVDLRAEAAIAPMLSLLRETDGDDGLSDRIVGRLPELGKPIVEPVLAEHATAVDDDYALMLTEMLANCGVRDERVWQVLLRALEYAPEMAAGLMGNYGDERALPLIEQAIRGLERAGSGEWEIFELNDLVSAYLELTDHLPDELAEYVELRREVLNRPPAPAVSAKVGRNDPCPCGSGKKYKRCCIE